MPEADSLPIASWYLARLSQVLKKRGLSLTISTDFVAFKKLITNHRFGSHIAGKYEFSTAKNNDQNAFWIKVTTSKGQLVHFQAVRLIELNGTTLADHMQAHFFDYVDRKIRIDVEISGHALGPNAEEMSGCIAYQGTYWLKGGLNGAEGSQLTELLNKMMFAVAIMRWRPDHIFTLMSDFSTCHGCATTAGFINTEPGNLIITNRKKPKRHKSWTVWASLDDVCHQMRLGIDRLYEPPQAEKRKRTRKKPKPKPKPKKSSDKLSKAKVNKSRLADEKD